MQHLLTSDCHSALVDSRLTLVGSALVECALIKIFVNLEIMLHYFYHDMMGYVGYLQAKIFGTRHIAGEPSISASLCHPLVCLSRNV